MSQLVRIPDCANPFEVYINHKKYSYPAGEMVEVPDEVAALIEAHNKKHEDMQIPIEPPFNIEIEDLDVHAEYYPSLSAAITDINNGVTTNALTDISYAKAKVFNAENGRLTVMLLGDISEGAEITIRKDINLVLNGKVLTFTNAAARLAFGTGTKCVIDGEIAGSKIKMGAGITATASTQLVRCEGEELAVKGGNYESSLSNTKTINVFRQYAGILVLDGCSVYAHNTGSYKATGCTSDAATEVKNCHITAIAEQNNTICIMPGKSLTVDGSELIARVNAPYSKDANKTPPVASGIVTDATYCDVCKVSSSKIVADAIGNDKDEPNGIGIANNGVELFLKDTNCFGTHSGVGNELGGKLYVSGGTFTGHSHGGFYFVHGTTGKAFVKDAVIRCGNYEGIFTEEFADGNTIDNIPLAGFYVASPGNAGSNGSTVDLDGCTVGIPGCPGFVLRGTSGEKNCTVNISNSTIVDGCTPIRVDNETHKLNVGIGCNITADKIGSPSRAEFTGKLYRKLHGRETMSGNDFNALAAYMDALQA